MDVEWSFVVPAVPAFVLVSLQDGITDGDPPRVAQFFRVGHKGNKKPASVCHGRNPVEGRDTPEAGKVILPMFSGFLRPDPPWDT